MKAKNKNGTICLRLFVVFIYHLSELACYIHNYTIIRHRLNLNIVKPTDIL